MFKKPQILINIFTFNSQGDKILIGKRFDGGLYNIISGKLNYGEGFEECGQRLLTETANISINDVSRIRFLCSYNVIDKIWNQHYISIAMILQLTQEEEKTNFEVDPYLFKTLDWFDFEQISKLQENLYLSLEIFFKKFKIKSLDDIKKLDAN